LYLSRFAFLTGLFFAFLSTSVAATTPAQTPTFSVSAGSYLITQTVTIGDATAGAVIYYTTNGVAPTTASTVYTGPLTVANSMTLRAIAAVPSGVASSVMTAVYTLAPAATPTFSVPAGTYQTRQLVTISDATARAVIYYTTNGVAPTTASTVYTGPLTVANSMTLRAIAAVPSGVASSVMTAVYTLAPAATPTFNVPAGTYQTTQAVTISDATAGVVIYYTTSGVAPTISSAVYSGPITVTNTITLRAIAAFPNGPASGTMTAVYNLTSAATPTFSVPAGTYQTTRTVTISDATAGVVIYYTKDGVAPTTSSAIYSAPISVTETMKLRAIAAFPDGPASGTITSVYNITPAAIPTLSPAAGAYTGTQTVTISDATAGAAIYFTTNGLAPTIASARYTVPVSVGSTMKVRAIAAFPNGPPSATATAVYTITQSPTPVGTPNSSSTFFGMDINDLLSGTPWPIVPVGGIRLWDTNTNWGNLNPASGTYNWSRLGQQIDLARANGAQILYTFGGSPSWTLPANVPIESIHRSAGVVTITTTVPHGLYFSSLQTSTSQERFTVTGVSDVSFNGTFYLTGTPTSDTFTYAQSGADATSSLGTVSAVCSGTYAPASCAEQPASLSDWDEFVTQLISHVGPDAIQYWEVWNEPNISGFWDGDPKTLVSMAQHAHGIIKSVDPKAIILNPGYTGNYETQVECTGAPSFCGSAWLSTWLDLGGKNVIDAVAFHGYPQINVAPEEIQGAVNLLKATMARSGVGALPLIDTESAWGRNVNLPNETDQIAWLAKHLLLEQSMGVQHTFWYAYDSPSWGTLWSISGGLNPVGDAYEQVEKWLTGTTLSQPCAALPDDPTTFVCSYTRPKGYVAQAVWNTAGDKTYTVPSQFLQYHDLSGAVQSIGGGTVTISTTPILLESSSVF
jgi:hypothetical protein